MDPVKELLARDQHGIKFGLDNIRVLCEALGHPQRSAPTVLIGGTNGKGSVTAMTATALSAAGHRTGRYTSPHLVHFEERFVVDGRSVDAGLLGAAVEAVASAEARAIAKGFLHGPVTFFEFTTATAFELFRRAGVDVSVLEVGMGGRFDATNVAEPCASAITSIDFDHMRFLGNTLAAIAFEKAGILRPDRVVVTGPLPPEAAAVVRGAAAARGAHYLEAFDGAVARAAIGNDGRTELSLKTPSHDYGAMTLALRGRHQVVNAVVATRLLEEIDRSGTPVPPDALIAGLSGAVWPARLQELTTAAGVRVLLDAAHNPAGATSLVEYLRETQAPTAALVFGVMRDKDVTPMLEVLAPRASHLVFTSAESPRARPAAELDAIAKELGLQLPTFVRTSSLEAFELAARLSPFVIVAGSMFVIGELLPAVTAASAEPQPGTPDGYGMLRASRG